jgi:hypothetical protein
MKMLRGIIGSITEEATGIPREFIMKSIFCTLCALNEHHAMKAYWGVKV